MEWNMDMAEIADAQEKVCDASIVIGRLKRQNIGTPEEHAELAQAVARLDAVLERMMECARAKNA